MGATRSVTTCARQCRGYSRLQDSALRLPHAREGGAAHALPTCAADAQSTTHFCYAQRGNGPRASSGVTAVLLVRWGKQHLDCGAAQRVDARQPPRVRGLADRELQQRGLERVQPRRRGEPARDGAQRRADRARQLVLDETDLLERIVVFGPRLHGSACPEQVSMLSTLVKTRTGSLCFSTAAALRGAYTCP